ncbi:MAG: M3 family metallopeptidase [Anaerovoracaceae bacterium]
MGTLHAFVIHGAKTSLSYTAATVFSLRKTASTVNENLLMKHLIRKEKDPQMKKYLLKYAHRGIPHHPLPPDNVRRIRTADARGHRSRGNAHGQLDVCEKYQELNRKYFGPAIADDDYIKYEWARIPHFYNAFYVYKYATGYSAAAAISDIILEKGSDDYIEFLKTGESDYPIELLKIAGVDMSSEEPIRKGHGGVHCTGR